MIIDCIADLHGYYPALEGGDLLIVAGDLTKRDERVEYFKFWQWAAGQRYKKIVIVAGNHDNFLQKTGDPLTDPGIFSYLCDSGTEFQQFKIWGSPWTLSFEGLNPRYAAFTGTEAELEAKFSLIPHDIDILVTHGPSIGTLDLTMESVHAGSVSLLKAEQRVRPRLHAFGHIHEARGKFSESCRLKSGEVRECASINCSIVDFYYRPVNKPVRIVL